MTATEPIAQNERLQNPPEVRFTKSFISQVKNPDQNAIDPDDLVKLKRLGEGAFATVDLCRVAIGGKAEIVAVKRMKSELLNNPDDLRCFVAECRTLRSLNHPNIVPCLGVGSASKATIEDEFRTLFLVQEYAPGGSLRDLLLKQASSARNVYTFTQALDICFDIATGLAYLHGLRPLHLLHRDLKPANVLLHFSKEKIKGGNERIIRAKLADLGLCKVMQRRATQVGRSLKKANSCLSAGYVEAVASADSFDLQLTGRTGSLLYMAPEVHTLDGDSQGCYDESADIFSLGLIIWELFRRQLREVYLEQQAQLIRAAERTANGHRPEIPENWPQELKDLVAACWHQDPDLRPSAEEVGKQLEDMRQVVKKTMDAPKGISKLLARFMTK